MGAKGAPLTRQVVPKGCGKRFLGLTGFQPEGGGGSAAIFNKALKPALSGGGKTIQPRLRRVGNAPLLPTASPPVGEICSMFTLALT